MSGRLVETSARAAIGHAATPLRSVINFRLLMGSPQTRTVSYHTAPLNVCVVHHSKTESRMSEMGQ